MSSRGGPILGLNRYDTPHEWAIEKLFYPSIGILGRYHQLKNQLKRTNRSQVIQKRAVFLSTEPGWYASRVSNLKFFFTSRWLSLVGIIMLKISPNGQAVLELFTKVYMIHPVRGRKFKLGLCTSFRPKKCPGEIWTRLVEWFSRY